MGRGVTIGADWTKHRPLARRIARDYYFPGADQQDVEQEALIGLWIAARTYDGTGRFSIWAGIIIRRRLITMLKKARTPKYRLLTDATREDFVLVTGGDEPERIAIDRDRLARIASAMSSLTPRERKAVADHLDGVHSKSTKSHDSSLTRARHKLREAAA